MKITGGRRAQVYEARGHILLRVWPQCEVDPRPRGVEARAATAIRPPPLSPPPGRADQAGMYPKEAPPRVHRHGSQLVGSLQRLSSASLLPRYPRHCPHSSCAQACVYAWFQPKKDPPTVGWLPAVIVEVKKSAAPRVLNDWKGSWRYFDNAYITIQHSQSPSELPVLHTRV